MDRLVYTAVSGMTAAMNRQRMVASNMANAQTIGFRAEVMQASPVTVDGSSLEVRAMNRSEVRGAQMRAGAMIQTGRELDVACTGDTLIAVQAAGVNFPDLLIVQKKYQLQPPLPFTPGAELAGVVDAVGPQ